MALGGHDGTVNGNGRLRSAEIYDPGLKSKTFSFLPELKNSFCCSDQPVGPPARHDGGQVGFLSGDLRRPDLRHRRLQRDGGARQSGALRCGAAAVEALHLPCHSPFRHQVSFYLCVMPSSFWQCAGRLCSRTEFMFWVGSMARRCCVR